jgi:hypothetical protein
MEGKTPHPDYTASVKRAQPTAREIGDSRAPMLKARFCGAAHGRYSGILVRCEKSP